MVSLCPRDSLHYLKDDRVTGLSVQSCGVANCDGPVRADGERSRFWQDPQSSIKSSLWTDDDMAK